MRPFALLFSSSQSREISTLQNFSKSENITSWCSNWDWFITFIMFLHKLMLVRRFPKKSRAQERKLNTMCSASAMLAWMCTLTMWYQSSALNWQNLLQGKLEVGMHSCRYHNKWANLKTADECKVDLAKGTMDRKEPNLIDWFSTLISHIPYCRNYSSMESIIKAILNMEGSCKAPIQMSTRR